MHRSLHVVFALALLIPALRAAADTWYVDATACPGPGMGTIGDPFCSIQAGIDAAADGDVVQAAPGTYVESIDLLGKAITVRSASADPDDSIIDGAGVFHVVQCVSGEGPLTVLEGFTITGGNADADASPDDRGGGMLNIGGSPTVRDCVFLENESRASGAGMDNFASHPLVTGCSFRDNRTINGNGAGMHNAGGSTPTISGCRFEINRAGGLEGDGGGMYNAAGSDAVVTGCTFEHNFALGNRGGGMYNFACSPTVTGCDFVDNVAMGGGGMYNRSTAGNAVVPRVTGCRFTGNSANTLGGGGGMVNLLDSNAAVTNCTFTGNTGDKSGGAGMVNAICAPTVTNCTFTGNRSFAVKGGGTMANTNAGVVVTNCIFWANDVGGDDIVGDLENVTFSVVEGGYPGVGNIDGDPLFVDADGPDDEYGTEDDDVRLFPGSPCIDAANNDAPALAGVVEDVAGNPRFVNDPQSAECPQEPGGCGTPPFADIGAIEYQPPCPADADHSADVDFSDLINLLFVWGPCRGCPEDNDGDGEVDFFDLILLLFAWGPCPQPGACCLPDGTCEPATLLGGPVCADLGGVYLGDGSLCVDATCVQPGACCLPDGSCSPAARLGGPECLVEGGLYQGDDTTCDGVMCPAPTACCFADETCDQQFEQECASNGGIFQGENTVCATVSCPPPAACCLPDATCAQRFELDCLANGGIFQGNDVLCANVVCPQPGACCHPSFGCVQESELGGPNCAAADGVYQGDDTDCADVICGQRAACCLPDSTCDILFEEICDAAGGTFLGEGEVCSFVCDSGACCLPSGSCFVVSPDACETANGEYQGGGTQCEMVDCP